MPLPGQLGHRVHRRGLHRIRLPEHPAARVPVHGARRRIHQRRNPGPPRRAEHFERAPRIHRRRQFRLLLRTRHREHRRQVGDPRDAHERGFERLRVGDVPLDHLHPGEALHIGTQPGGKVVEHAHRLAGLRRAPREPVADEPGAAGDEEHWDSGPRPPAARPVRRAARVRAARKPNSVPRTGRPERDGGHVSSPTVTRRIERPTRKHRTGGPRALPYLVLLHAGFTVPRTSLPGRCALTAPFHPYRSANGEAVCFLWHFPSSYPDWALPSALPCGVRTFLPPPEGSRRPSERLEPPRIVVAGGGAAAQRNCAESPPGEARQGDVGATGTLRVDRPECGRERTATRELRATVARKSLDL